MKNKFENLGYLILKNFWSSEEINNFHISFDDLLKLQLNKMGLLDVKKTFLNIEDSIQYLSVLLEQNNRNAFN